jgi:hypothetical protein
VVASFASRQSVRPRRRCTATENEITPPLCGPCGRQHDPAIACIPDDAALSVYTPTRAVRQAECDHLEAVSIARYGFHRPVHRSARHRRLPVPAHLRRPSRDAHHTVAPSPALSTAIAAVIALLAVDLVLTVLIAVGLH